MVFRQLGARPRPDLTHVLTFLCRADVGLEQHKNPQNFRHQLFAFGRTGTELALQLLEEIPFAVIEVLDKPLIELVKERRRPEL